MIARLPRMEPNVRRRRAMLLTVAVLTSLSVHAEPTRVYMIGNSLTDEVK